MSFCLIILAGGNSHRFRSNIGKPYQKLAGKSLIEINVIKARKFNQIKKKWPNHRIESHIMSKKPNKYLKKIIPHSDVIYFHHEIEEDLNIIKEELFPNKSFQEREINYDN